MKKLLVLIVSACILVPGCGKKTYEVNLHEVVVAVTDKGLSSTDLAQNAKTTM